MADTQSLIPDFNNYFAGQKAATQGLLSGQNVEQGNFLNRYGDAIKSQETQSQMADRIGNQYNLPTLSKNAFNAQQAVYDAPQVTTDAARGSEINQNQLDRQKNYQLQKLAPIAQRAQDQANFAQNTVNTQMGYATKDQEKALSLFPVEQQMMMDRQARETSLFSSGQEQELNSIIAKMNAGIQISEGEKNRAQQLAIGEKNYNLELQKLAQNQTQFSSSQSQPMSVSPGNKVIDPKTGKVIYDAPYKPTSTGSGTNLDSFYGSSSTPSIKQQANGQWTF